MRFGLLQGAHCSAGVTPQQRYTEIIDEAVCAEESGFEFYATAEQHFDPGSGTTTIPASEIIQAAVAARTSVIRLIWASAVLPIHHPIRVAEKAATLDIISKGRFELGTARSNDLPTMRAFGVDPATTRDRWEEALGIVISAMVDGEVDHDGAFWQIPKTTISPQPVQRPHPPLWYASTSLSGHEVAGSLGLGVISGNSLPGGWDYVQEAADTYRRAVAQAKPIGGASVNNGVMGFCFAAHVSSSREQALREASATVEAILETVTKMFSRLAKQGAGYEYMREIEAIYERRDDLDYIIDRAPYISVGTPDFLVDRFKRMELMGYDRIALRIDGMPHETVMQSIRAFGEHVLPNFA
ncbi:LLM class flavin-dependent oxidoreductase [Nocardia sp. NPDC050408]|uniref:LLM class flavin-dependent oxidoreductase n=1 Tax=Nocardia sp. NPDC050408 TaxID=3364319 RepID=UPI0037B11598